MNIDVKNVNIWKSGNETGAMNEYRQADIEELCLTVRSYNCLRRSGCKNVGDVVELIGEDGSGLMHVRNLGKKSYDEIMENVKKLESLYRAKVPSPAASVRRVLLIPEGKAWNSNISIFHLSEKTFERLKACGIRKVGDIYQKELKEDPGWCAIRELFDAIAVKMV